VRLFENGWIGCKRVSKHRSPDFQTGSKKMEKGIKDNPRVRLLIAD
jgi:hypothetical protein